MKAKIRPKKKTASLAALKRKCDKVFSEYIRRRDIDRNGTTACVTCGNRKPWQQMQAGHFVSRVHLATRYSGVNVNVQCGACNVLRRGNMVEYAAYMERTYGYGVIERLLAEKRKTVKFTKADYLEMIDRFTADTPVEKKVKPKKQAAGIPETSAEDDPFYDEYVPEEAV